MEIDENKSMGILKMALCVNDKNATYFDSFRVE